jgi:hypothetical protein
MAELTYDQFSSSNDLTEMASQVNAAIAKLSKRIDELDGGAGALLDPMSQGVAINLADSFGRTLEAYLNNPNKRMLGDWILEGTLVVNGPTTINGALAVVGASTVTGDMDIAGDLTLTTGILKTAETSGEYSFIDSSNPLLMQYSTDATGELYPGVSGLYYGAGTQYELRLTVPVNSFTGSSHYPTIRLIDSYAGTGIDSRIDLEADYVTLDGQLQADYGTSSLPGVSFEGNTNTGMYRVAADQIGFTTGGVLRGRFYSGGLLMGANLTGDVQISGIPGTAALPNYSFYGDTNTGMYRKASDTIGFSTGGAERAYLNSNGLYLASGDWFRTTGSAGWYNQTYGGGWYMTDTTWVKAYNSKGIQTLGGIAAGLVATASTSGYQYVMRSTAYTVLAYYTSSRKLKESIVDVTPADSGAWMDALQPVMFTERWLGEGVEPADEKGWREADVQVGFIAEDVLENDIISQFSQANSVDGELKAVGWKWECVIAASVAEIKSLRSRLAAAEDMNEALDERLKLLEKKV